MLSRVLSSVLTSLLHRSRRRRIRSSRTTAITAWGLKFLSLTGPKCDRCAEHELRCNRRRSRYDRRGIEPKSLSLQEFLALGDKCVDLGITSTDPVIALIQMRLKNEIVAMVPFVGNTDPEVRRKQVTDIASGDCQPYDSLDMMRSKIEAKLDLKLSDAAPKVRGGPRTGDISTTPVTIATEDDWSFAVAITTQWVEQSIRAEQTVLGSWVWTTYQLCL